MGKFLFVLLFLSAQSVWATCPNKINPKKVMLFIDTNLSDLEIISARKAACSRGERLEVVPKNYKEYAAYTTPVQNGMAALDACKKKNNVTTANYRMKTGTTCFEFKEALDKVTDKMYDFIGTQPQIEQQLKARMDELKKENVKLTNVSVSGHDGGGDFGGDKGDISRQEIALIMGNYPEMNDVQSLLLLGCYTGVQNEVAAWKGIFPKVKIIGGYDGSAPLSTRPQGHTYISNILTKEKQLKSLKNKNTVDQDVKRLVGNLNALNSAFYIDIACSEDESEYYYASKTGRKFNKLNLSDCEKAATEIEKIRPLYMSYYTGDKEPPTNTSSGEMRGLYDKLRTYQHCLDTDEIDAKELNSNGAFNLLFWHGVKKNYAEFYDKELKEAEAILADLNVDEILKNFSSDIASLEAENQLDNNEIAAYNKDPEGYKKKIEEDFKKIMAEGQALMSNPMWSDLNAKLQKDPSYVPTPEEKVFQDKQLKLRRESLHISVTKSSLENGGAAFLEEKKSRIQYRDGEIKDMNLKLAKFQSGPDSIKDLWVPTKEQMEKRTRKELMSNLHKMHGALQDLRLPAKQQAALRFITRSAQVHLQNFNNPFSWHEYAGRPEAPTSRVVWDASGKGDNDW